MLNTVQIFKLQIVYLNSNSEFWAWAFICNLHQINHWAREGRKRYCYVISVNNSRLARSVCSLVVDTQLTCHSSANTPELCVWPPGQVGAFNQWPSLSLVSIRGLHGCGGYGDSAERMGDPWYRVPNCTGSPWGGGTPRSHTACSADSISVSAVTLEV